MIPATKKVSVIFRGNPVTFTAVYLPIPTQNNAQFWMRFCVAAPLLRMIAAASQAGVSLQLNSALRDQDKQRRLYEERMDLPHDSAETRTRKAEIRKRLGVAAKPGNSYHEVGLALDFKNLGNAYAWLKSNAETFGFKGTVKSEPWHYVYTGPCVEYQGPTDSNWGLILAGLVPVAAYFLWSYLNQNRLKLFNEPRAEPEARVVVLSPKALPASTGRFTDDDDL